MKITVSQAATKLKVTNAAVRDMIKDGLLKDYAVRKNGKKRHYAILDSKEVNAFAKTYRKKTHHKNYKSIVITPTTTPKMGITTQMERIEQKIDKLLAIWS